MSLDPAPDLDKSRARTIVLAGKEWVVCPLPLRQVIAIGALLPKIRGVTVDTISEESFSPLIELIERALKKAYPGITAEDLLDLPIGIDEIMTAVPIIVEQAGGKRADDAAGEAEAASPLNPPTGADSSPTS